jgi:hypothetical protein
VDNKVKTKQIGFFSFLMLIIFSITIRGRADAGIGWEDTFDTIDSLDDWEVSHGNYTVDEAQGVLVGSADCYLEPGPNWCANYLWRNSTASTGTWSFDIILPETFLFFIYYYVGISSTADGRHPTSGYSLLIFPSEIWIGSDNGTLDSYTLVDSLDGWQHFDIIRTETGHIQAFLNGTNILNGINTVHTFSEKINIQVEPETKLDNIIYSPEASISTTTTTASTNFSSVVILLGSSGILVYVRKKTKSVSLLSFFFSKGNKSIN